MHIYKMERSDSLFQFQASGYVYVYVYCIEIMLTWNRLHFECGENIALVSKIAGW